MEFIILVGLFILIYLFYLILDDSIEKPNTSFDSAIQQILKESGFELLPYQIVESNTKTYTVNKSKIHLLSQHYNYDTLLFVVLHEMAHILCPDVGHTDLFYDIETKLHRKAVELGYMDIDHIQQDYPCNQL